MRLMLGAALAATLLLTSCGGSDSDGGDSGSDEEKATALESAAEACLPGVDEFLVKGKMDDEAAAEEFLTLADEGKSISIQNPPQGGGNSAPATLLAITCVLEETSAPHSVTAQLEQTTALMGRQETDWDSIEMSWSYHPDDGVSAILTED